MWGTIIGMGTSVVSNVIGQLMAGGQYDKAMQLRQEAAQQWNIPLPQFDKMVAQTVNQSFASPVARQAQMSALQQMQNVANSGGNDAISQAANMDAQAHASQQLESNNAAILANRRARGIGGSGDELATELIGSQGAGQNVALAGASAAAAARQRALMAMAQGGQAAGALRSGDLAQSDAEAALGKFNAGMRTAATQYNNQLGQDTFNDQARRAGGYADALNGVANGYVQQGNRIGNDFATAGKAAAGVGSSIDEYNNDQGQGPTKVDPTTPKTDSGLNPKRPIGTGTGYSGGSW